MRFISIVNCLCIVLEYELRRFLKYCYLFYELF